METKCHPKARNTRVLYLSLLKSPRGSKINQKLSYLMFQLTPIYVQITDYKLIKVKVYSYVATFRFRIYRRVNAIYLCK